MENIENAIKSISISGYKQDDFTYKVNTIKKLLFNNNLYIEKYYFGINIYILLIDCA